MRWVEVIVIVIVFVFVFVFVFVNFSARGQSPTKGPPAVSGTWSQSMRGVERRGAPFWGGVQARAGVAFTLKLLMTIQG